MPHPSQEDNDVDEFEDDEEIGEDEEVDDTIHEQGGMTGEKLLLQDFSLNENEAEEVHPKFSKS